MRSMKNFITGIYGFFGSKLTKAFSQDYDICGIDIVNLKKDGVILGIEQLQVKAAERLIMNTKSFER